MPLGPCPLLKGLDAGEGRRLDLMVDEFEALEELGQQGYGAEHVLSSLLKGSNLLSVCDLWQRSSPGKGGIRMDAILSLTAMHWAILCDVRIR